jgi:glycosyltransferase involved in cell wall biosynthesis
MADSTRPAVSVVLPTFNRAEMLAECLQSLEQQVFEDWELVVVNDGSTDRNRQVVEEFATRVSQRVVSVHQANQGAGVARQNGVSRATGDLVAFMDSDDPWLAHHLADSVSILSRNPDVDWLVSPARVFDHRTGRIVQENSFMPNGVLRPSTAFAACERNGVFVLQEQGLTEHVIRKGFPGGLQASVLRRWIVERVRFRNYRLFEIESVAHGARIAYVLDPHIVYRIHDQNVSLVASQGTGVEKRSNVLRDGVAIFGELSREAVFSARQQRMLRNRQAEIVFWDLGYNTFLQHGLRRRALRAFAEGLSLSPCDFGMWKVLLKASVWPCTFPAG